jgi:two-component system, OmpR family, sensor kinase
VRGIRGRLTVSFTIALLLALGGFGAALYYELKQPSVIALDERTGLEMKFALNWLQGSYRLVGPLVVAQDSMPPTLNSGISAAFESSRDYLVIVGENRQALFLSDAARNLEFGAIDRLRAEAGRAGSAEPAERVGTLELDPARTVRYRVARVDSAGPGLSALIVATPLNNLTIDPALILRAMGVVAPLVVLLAAGLGYWLAGRALAPVQSITDEVDAITDGRSLHRRLAVPLSADEISRLALTLNRMLARLEQSFGSLHRFTADASHELKTPLMVLRAGVERALTHPATPPDAIGALDETLEQINQMSEMVDNLLTLARADEGRAPLAVEECDLRDLVAEASETAGMLAEAGDVRVTTSIPEQPVPLAVDRHRIRELLLNLVTNAVKYTPTGGQVGLELSEGGTDVTIVVRDTGIGIAPGDLPHIFDRFWRADAARSRTGDRPGVGLGLAITKWIAEAHGGSITVQSRPGRGTAFTVILPRSRPADR